MIVRYLHIVAGVGWLGEVMVINLVLVPALKSAKATERIALLEIVFPRLFRLASVLGGLAVVTGAVLLAWYTQLQPHLLLASRWGWFVATGGLLAFLLYLFHLFQESKMEHTLMSNLVVAIQAGDSQAMATMLRRLAILPRAGMAALLVAVLLMVAAAHLG